MSDDKPAMNRETIHGKDHDEVRNAGIKSAEDAGLEVLATLDLFTSKDDPPRAVLGICATGISPGVSDAETILRISPIIILELLKRMNTSPPSEDAGLILSEMTHLTDLLTKELLRVLEPAGDEIDEMLSDLLNPKDQ